MHSSCIFFQENGNCSIVFGYKMQVLRLKLEALFVVYIVIWVEAKQTNFTCYKASGQRYKTVWQTDTNT